jgi:hypothetical protein
MTGDDMSDAPNQTPQQDARFHTYATHRIPWYVRLMWLMFWIGLIWYVIAFAIPAAKEYF